MIRFASLALASVSVLAIASTASAQAAPPGPAAAPSQEATLGEIVVTARRRTESLQEVPQTVTPVTSETLQKLNIRQFQDIQSVVPGLSLATTSSGFQNSASLRGVTFEVNTGAQPTVAFYLNDAPVQLSFIFQSLFDLGQVEVLKGPQGTNRGISAPSGAITITTRKPDLSDFGGYADVTATDQHGRNAQAAINVPIVKDVLAVRVAGLIDTNDGNDVRSLHNPIRPRGQTDAVRASVSFEPSDIFNANVTYQHLDNELSNFTQLTGPGSGPFTIGADSFPASLNPPLTVGDRASVQDFMNDTKTHEDLVVAQLDSRLFGQHLSYVGSYSKFKVRGVQESGNPSAGDVGNILPGIGIFQTIESDQEETTHEFRVASDPAPGRFFDYTVGAFYHWVAPNGHIVNPGSLLPGAFGASPVPSLAGYNPAYQIPVFIDIPSSRQETSLFGSVTLHLPWDTELSGGVRHMWSIVNNATQITLGDGLLSKGAIGQSAAFPCAFLAGAFPFPVSEGSPGNCAIHSAGVVANLTSHSSETPTIYNISLSHHFTRDFLVYANTGSAYRAPVASVGIQGQLAGAILPGAGSLTFHPAEKSKSYEVGFKSTWLDGRWRLNASVFRQKFRGFSLYVPNVVYNNVNPGLDPATAGSPTTFSFTTSVGALVKGVDIDTAFQITPEWSVSGQLSYADGSVTSGSVPCNITDATGKPVFNTGGLISLCKGGSASRLPYWNATVQSEYSHPVTESMDGFVRLLATYYPKNENRAEANFTVNDYALVNFYAGMRSHDGAWEASLFVRNAFNVERATDISTVQANLGQVLAGFPTVNHATGYYETITNSPREVGINVHYAWGSR